MARLKLFAALREAAGESEVEIQAHDIAGLLAKAIQRYPPEFSAALDSASVLLNGTPAGALAGNRTKLSANDEVALLPPVSGGAESIEARMEAGQRVRGEFSPAPAQFAVLSAILLSSLLPPIFFAGAVAVLAAAAAAQSRRESTPGGIPFWVAGALACAFPLAAQAGEGAFLIALGAMMLALGILAVVAGAGTGMRVSVATLAATTAPVLLIGFLISYLVLIRSMPRGSDLFIAVWLIVVSYHLASYLAARFAPASAERMSILAGLLVAPLGGLASLLLIENFFGVGPVLVLGLLAGAGAALGQLTGSLILRTQPAPSQRLHLAAAVESFAFAAPAFYYGFHLYLT